LREFLFGKATLLQIAVRDCGISAITGIAMEVGIELTARL
jgi:hypothetical protein